MSKICKKRVHGNEKMSLPCAFGNCPGSLHFTLLLNDIVSLLYENVLEMQKMFTDTVTSANTEKGQNQTGNTRGVE